MRLRLLSGKRADESKLRVNALLFVPRQTLNSITTKPFITSDSSHGSKHSLIFENYNKSNLDSSQDSGDSPILNYNLTELHPPQGSGVVDRLCPESSTDSNAFIGSKLATLDDTPAGINRSRPNLKDLCDNGCVIPPLHESGHFASTGTIRSGHRWQGPATISRRNRSQPDKLTDTKLVEHVIDTQEHPPIKQKNHRMSPNVCDEFVKIAEQLIDQELVEPRASSGVIQWSWFARETAHTTCA